MVGCSVHRHAAEPQKGRKGDLCHERIGIVDRRPRDVTASKDPVDIDTDLTANLVSMFRRSLDAPSPLP